MTAGTGEQRSSSPAADVPSQGWGLRDQKGKVWSLLERQPELRTVPLAGAALVEGWVAS